MSRMMNLGKYCEVLLLVLLLLASYGCIYIEFWKPLCLKPFVEIGDKCYFFSTNKVATYEYYKISYNGRIFSVPAMLDWLQASFACETLDARARLVSVESDEEMRHLANFMRHYAHANTHPVFWSAGHRGNLADQVFDENTMDNFYWHNEPQPMNFTNFPIDAPATSRLPPGYCVHLEFAESQLVMGSASCAHKLAFACELQPLD